MPSLEFWSLATRKSLCLWCLCLFSSLLFRVSTDRRICCVLRRMFGSPLSSACPHLRNPSTAVSTRTRKQVCLKRSSARNHWLCFGVRMCDCGPWQGPVTFDTNITESVWVVVHRRVCVSKIRDATCAYIHKAVTHSQSWFCKEMQKPPVLVLATYWPSFFHWLVFTCSEGWHHYQLLWPLSQCVRIVHWII